MRQLVCLVAVFSLIAVSGVLAQTGIDGAILGVVTDANGGAVAGATVTVTNLGTSIPRVETSRSDGSFEIDALPEGNYSVTVTFAGFKTWTIAKTDLTISERKRITPVLQVGDVNERVSVEATADLLQTEKAETGGVVEARTIQELPLNGRDVVELTELVPGVRYEGRSFSTACADGNTSSVQGLGHRDDQTEFRVDGVASNAVCDEGSTAIPNPDTIAEFNVSTSNFSAENGRNPVFVNMVTKSGTNDYHVTLWEFLRNNDLDARNFFASSVPVLKQNQFGLAGGGPILIPKLYNGKNKTFIFGSYEGTRTDQSQIINTYTVSPQMLTGNFAGLPTIKDPTTGLPFAGNQIPQSQISAASQFFFPWIVLPNSPGNIYNALAPTFINNDEFSGRVDHQITQNQRIYWRILHLNTPQNIVGYRPSITGTEDTHSYSTGLNYDYTINPTTLLSLSIGTVNTVNTTLPTCNGNGPCTEIGQENLTAEAGIQGFQTAGREQWIGLPDVISFAGYGDISSRVGWGTPSIFKTQSINGNASVSKVWGKHTIVTGYQYDHLYLLASHGSCCSKGTFDFNGQYSGNGFADYLLGYLDNSNRDYPIHTFGMKSNPYGAFFVDDSWKLSPRFTLELGLRWDYWFAKSLIRGAGSTFDPATGKAIAGEDNAGQVDLTSQPVAPFLGAATAGLWESASQAHVPAGLFEPSGYVSPRIGGAWRPLKSGDMVVRAAYGTFASSYRGNITASQIVGPPYWTYETQSWGPSQLQRWETAWPVNPNSFVTPGVAAAAYNVKPMIDHEWNVSIQKTLPFKMAGTASYVGSSSDRLVVQSSLNEVPAGNYPNLQAAKPYSAFGAIDLFDNVGHSWYNSAQLKVERRFAQGLSFVFSYAFSKNMSENGADSVYSTPTPFAPNGYNRGLSPFDHANILAANVVWDIPIGKGHALGGNWNTLTNAMIGGWEFSGIYLYSSGDPLTFGVPGATLGNGWGTRPDVVGNPNVSSPNANLWFNPAAFVAPPDFQFGSSGIGIMTGPGSHVANLALMKKFYFMEGRYLQFRWEAFNAFNNVNFADPNTTINQGSTGQIFSAGPARVMQVALKLIF